jgi:hypothetical protein
MEDTGAGDLDAPLLQGGGRADRINVVGGVIFKSEMMRLRKLLYRSTRGKTLTEFYEMEVPAADQVKETKNYHHQVVYLVIYEHGDALRDKVQRIC